MYWNIGIDISSELSIASRLSHVSHLLYFYDESSSFSRDERCDEVENYYYWFSLKQTTKTKCALISKVHEYIHHQRTFQFWNDHKNLSFFFCILLISYHLCEFLYFIELIQVKMNNCWKIEFNLIRKRSGLISDI